MLDMITKYFKIIANTLIGIAFGFAFFYIILNINHYLEIRREYNFNSNNDITIGNIKNNLNMINNNISVPIVNQAINGKDTNVLKNRFSICLNEINNEEFNKLISKDKINIKDVYNLREKYEDEVASVCLVNQFIWLINDNDDITQSLVNNDKGMLKILMNDLINDTSYVKKDILNNSSYYFSTEISMLNGKNLTKDSYYEVLSSYKKATDFLLELSNRYKNLVTNTEVK